jgi:hypothetical protein
MRPDKRYVLAFPAAILLAAATVLGAVLLARGASSPAAPAPEGKPAKVEKIARSNRFRIVLSKTAADRLGIETASIAPQPGHPGRRVIPYAAVLYDPTGGTFAYASPRPLTYVRRPIGVRSIAGGEAVLDTGPPAGTAVVTVGAAELLGAETGVEE